MSRTHRLAPIFLIISYLLQPFSLSFIRYPIFHCTSFHLCLIVHFFTYHSSFAARAALFPLDRLFPSFTAFLDTALYCFYCSLLFFDVLLFTDAVRLVRYIVGLPVE